MLGHGKRMGYIRTGLIAALVAVGSPLAQTQAGPAGASPDAAILQKWKQPIPPLALKDLQGRPRSLKEWRGKVLVVHFWATWCEPCVAEMPTLMRLKTEMRDEPFEVVTVNLGEADARIRDFYGKLGVDFVTLLDRDGDAKKQWRVGGVPMSFVLGADGRARYRYFGEIDWTSAEIGAKFAPLMREARRLQKPAVTSATKSEPGTATAPRNTG